MSEPESLKRGVANSAVGNLGANLISLAGFIVLARMLTPEEFGLMAVVAVLAGLSRVIVDLGLTDALVQNQGVTEKHYSTVFLMHLVLSFGYAMLAFMGANNIERLFDLDGLSWLVQVCAWVFIVNAFSLMPVSRLEKGRRFGLVARVELYSSLFSTVLAIILAWLGYGIWALVANLYSAGFMRAFLAFYLPRWRPKVHFGVEELAELWRFSRYLFVLQVYNYIVANLDKLLISRYLGANTLGAYRYGDKIAQMPVLMVNKIFGRVLFPTFSSNQTDKGRIRYHYLKAIRLVSFVSFPAILGVSMISEYIVLALLGDKWSEMAIILPMLVLSFLLGSIGVLNLNIYKALGRTKRLLKVSVVLRLNLMLCMVVGIQYGLVGLLAALIIARYINFIPALYIAGRLINVTLRDVMRNTFGALVSSGIMIGGLYICERIFVLIPGGILELLIMIALAVGLYISASLVLQRQSLTDLFNLAGFGKYPS